MITLDFEGLSCFAYVSMTHCVVDQIHTGVLNKLQASAYVKCLKILLDIQTVTDNAQCRLVYLGYPMGWLGGRVVRTSDSRLAVEGSPPGHDTAWLFISETGDHLWQVNCLENCNQHL